MHTLTRSEVESATQGESPTNILAIATGRAHCRVCGILIGKGTAEITFYHSFTDGSYNTWTATKCHAHRACVPEARFDYDDRP